jgi:hypothetical protein
VAAGGRACGLTTVQCGATESPPPKSSPAFLLRAPRSCAIAFSYVEDHKPIYVYIRNIIPLRIRLPSRRSCGLRAAAMLNFAFTVFSEVRYPQAMPKQHLKITRVAP